MEGGAVARLLERDARFLAGVGAQDQLVEAVDPAADREMVAIGSRADQIDAVRAGDHRPPFLRVRRVGLGEAEVHMVVVGVDPQFPVRRVDMIFAVGLARRDQRQRLGRIVGGDEAHLARRIVAGRDEDQALVLRLADPDAEAQLLRLLVKRDVGVGRRSQPVVAGAVAAPIVVDLVEDDAAAVAGPHRLADPDLGDRLDVLAGGEVADAELEPLRAVVVGQRRQQLAVRADLERAEAEIFLAFGLDRLVEDDLVVAAARPACGTRCGTARPAGTPTSRATRRRGSGPSCRPP